MKTLAQFKSENNVTSLEVLAYASGRKFANVGDKKLVFSSKCDTSKPLFVQPFNNYIDPKDPSKGSVVVPNTYILCNSTVVLTGETI